MENTVNSLTLEFTVINESGSVRIDLLGGTLDIEPINYVLRDTVTLNLATSLKAKVGIEKIEGNSVIIKSLDYKNENEFYSKDFTTENFDGDHFGPLSFVCQILHHFDVTCGVKLTLESGSPPGAGLGGSSTMGVTLYRALCQLTDRFFNRKEAIQTVRNIEAKILNKGPCGYQDYYPALYGGILGLVPKNEGIQVEQFYNENLATFLEEHLTLVYSGALRLSAINNWEVYKSFFDNDPIVREGLRRIARLAKGAYESLTREDYEFFLELICEEGREREELFSGIVTEEMRQFYRSLDEQGLVKGMKVCGAGGGGCFILVHDREYGSKISELVKNSDFTHLSFKVDKPL